MMQDGAGMDDGPRMVRMGSSMGLRLEDVTGGLTSVIVSLTEHGTEGFWRRGSMFGGDCPLAAAVSQRTKEGTHKPKKLHLTGTIEGKPAT